MILEKSVDEYFVLIDNTQARVLFHGYRNGVQILLFLLAHSRITFYFILYFCTSIHKNLH